jgi:hypothetical protein
MIGGPSGHPGSNPLLVDTSDTYCTEVTRSASDLQALVRFFFVDVVFFHGGIRNK